MVRRNVSFPNFDTINIMSLYQQTQYITYVTSETTCPMIVIQAGFYFIRLTGLIKSS